MLLFGSAMLVGLVGTVVLVGYGLKASGVEKKASALLGVVPTARVAKGAAKATAAKGAAKPQPTPPMGDGTGTGTGAV
jgi:hypothetical protein